jgi:hypothetical protein
MNVRHFRCRCPAGTGLYEHVARDPGVYDRLDGLRLPWIPVRSRRRLIFRFFPKVSPTASDKAVREPGISVERTCDVFGTLR